MKSLCLPSVPTTVKTENKLYGIASMGLAAFFWAALELIGNYIPSHYNALQTVWMRYGIHLIFMLIVFGPSHRINLVRTQSLKLQLLRPVLMIGMPLFFLLGIISMPQKNVWAIFWVAPLMAMGLSVLILKERIHWQYWLATIIGLAGIFAIYRPTVRLLTQWTIIFPLGMAFCFSLYLILTRRLRSESTVTNLFYTALVVFLPWSIGLPYFWQRLDIMAFVTMLAIGLLGFLTLYFLDKALGRAPASVLAPFLYSQPIFSMSLSSFLFGQSPGFIRLAGSIGLIGVGVFLALLRTQSDGQAQ